MRKKLVCVLLIVLLFSQPVFASELPAGAYVKIAVIDTGISVEAINTGLIAEGYNYINENNDTDDKIGHGTAVAGIISGSLSPVLSEAATGIKLVPLVIQTMDENGNMQKGNTDLIARAIKEAIDIYGCSVINLSIGTTVESASLSDAVEYAEEKNVVIISPVGNKNAGNTDILYYPAAYPTVIGIGSVNKYGRVSDFSMRNNSLMLVAPGEKIWTVSKNGKAFLTSGTSYATAFVSAAASALLYTCPELAADEVRSILCESATDILDTGYDIDSGWGILSTDKAMDMLKSGYTR